MPGKAPAFQFYPGDWARDLEEHPLEIEGAWIRICCKLWWSETRGRLSKTVEQWARIIRESPEKTLSILWYLHDEKIGDISGNLTEPNSHITVISRRMARDAKECINNRLRQKKFYDKNKPNAEPNSNLTSPSSTSSSTSTSNNDSQRDIGVKDSLNQTRDVPHDFFSDGYQFRKKTAREIIGHLNDVTGNNFPVDLGERYEGFRYIMERLEEGHIKDALNAMIDRKKKDPNYQKEWMNPVTLFKKINFDKYIYEREEDYGKLNDGSSGGSKKHRALMAQARLCKTDNAPFPVDATLE